jgi:hypothetical protein
MANVIRVGNDAGAEQRLGGRGGCNLPQTGRKESGFPSVRRGRGEINFVERNTLIPGRNNHGGTEIGCYWKI